LNVSLNNNVKRLSLPYFVIARAKPVAILKGFLVLFLFFLPTAFFAGEEGFHQGIAFVLKGEEALEAWQIDEAVKIAEELTERIGDEPRALLFAAKVRFYQGDYQEALDLVRKAKEKGYAGGDSIGFLDVLTKTAEAARGFTSTGSTHFIVRYKKGKDEILPGYALDALEKAYTTVGEDLGYFPRERVIVEIYPDIESFIQVSTLSRKDVETSGTVAICKFARIVITTPRVLLRGYPWLDTLSHEYVHYVVNRRTRGMVPIWLHEGIAKYEEARWRGKKGGDLTPSSQAILARALKENTLIPFEKMHPSLAKLKSAEEAQRAFAEVSTAVEFIKEQWGSAGLHKLLQSMSQGMPEDQACDSVLGLTSQGFFSAWKSWAMKKPITDIPGLRALPLRFRKDKGTGALKEPREDEEKQLEKEELKDIPSEAARKHLRLGDLLRDRNRIEAAIVEYQKATRKGALSPVAFNKLALAFMLNRDLDSALGPLMRARELFPDFVTTYVHLGQIYLERKDYERSLENFIMANSLNPFDPRIHAGMATIYKEKGKTDLQAHEERIYAILR